MLNIIFIFKANNKKRQGQFVWLYNLHDRPSITSLFALTDDATMAKWA
jgi:hypothetical protein